MTLLDLKPDAAPLFARLMIAAAELADNGHPAACQSDPGAFFADSRTEDAQAAVAACTWCPLIELCGTYADAQGERWGVWAGRRRSYSYPEATTEGEGRMTLTNPTTQLPTVMTGEI